MAESQKETVIQAFPDKATPLVSSGLSFDKACLKHLQGFNARRVFLLASLSLSKNTTCISTLQTTLGPILATTRTGLKPHTYVSEVLEIVQESREREVDAFVTIGGGTLTDAAKISAFALANDVHTVEDLHKLPTTHERNLPAKPTSIPIICIPTTLSGGDYSVYAGVTSDGTHQKTQYAPPLASPSLIIQDGNVTSTTPLEIWLQSGMRALNHCIESLTTTYCPADVQDATIKGLQALLPGLLKTKANPTDANARFICQQGVMHTMLFLHRGIICGASRGIGHMLGPFGKVAHGETSAILLPAVCKYNARHGTPLVLARQKLVQDLLFAIPITKEIFEKRGMTQGTDLGDLIYVIVQELGLKQTLEAVGVRRDQHKALAELSLKDTMVKDSPVPLTTVDQVMEVLELCA